MKETSIRERAARLNLVLRIVARTPSDSAATMLAFASVGMVYAGHAPENPAQLVRCIDVLSEADWMQARAFDFLSRFQNSAWPYVIAHWSELCELLTQDRDAGYDPKSYAPQTHALLHTLILRRCAKAYCSHPAEDHAFERDAHVGRCTVEGCRCGFFVALPEPAKVAGRRCSETANLAALTVPGGDEHESPRSLE